MPQNQNALATTAFQFAEKFNLPLEFLLNNIVARLITVLTPGQFGNCSSVGAEIVTRILLAILGLLLVVPVLIASLLWIVCNYVGDLLLGTDQFLYFPGNYTGPGTSQFATWNMASLVQPRTLVDGVDGGDDRVIQIANLLTDFHFVCGQEMDGAAARLMSQILSNDFAEFYSYMGKSNLPMLPAGIFFASKEKVLSVQFTPFVGADIQTSIKRGLSLFELQDYYVAVMHTDTGTDPGPQQARLHEFQQAIAVFNTLKKPIIWCGDLNEPRYNQPTPGFQLILQNFVDCIGAQNPGKTIITDTDVLHHDRFGEKTPVEEGSIDFIGYNKSQNALTLKFLSAEYHYDLSDHYMIRGEISKN